MHLILFFPWQRLLPETIARSPIYSMYSTIGIQLGYVPFILAFLVEPTLVCPDSGDSSSGIADTHLDISRGSLLKINIHNDSHHLFFCNECNETCGKDIRTPSLGEPETSAVFPKSNIAAIENEWHLCSIRPAPIVNYQYLHVKRCARMDLSMDYRYITFETSNQVAPSIEDKGSCKISGAACSCTSRHMINW